MQFIVALARATLVVLFQLVPRVVVVLFFAVLSVRDVVQFFLARRTVCPTFRRNVTDFFCRREVPYIVHRILKGVLGVNFVVEMQRSAFGF